jgi:transcriptional regulator with XRE-family HTH domain
MFNTDTPVIDPPAWSPHGTDRRPTRQLGREIVARREARGWMQAEFAGKVGIGAPKLSEIENERVNASLKLLVKIAEALGCQVAYLLRDFREPTC